MKSAIQDRTKAVELLQGLVNAAGYAGIIHRSYGQLLTRLGAALNLVLTQAEWEATSFCASMEAVCLTATEETCKVPPCSPRVLPVQVAPMVSNHVQTIYVHS